MYSSFNQFTMMAIIELAALITVVILIIGDAVDGQKQKNQPTDYEDLRDKEPAQNELGIFPCWMSLTRARGVSYSTTIMIINKLFLTEEDLEEYKSECKGNATQVGKDYKGLDVRTEYCEVTDKAVVRTMTLSKAGPEDEDMYDYNVTHKQVIVKPFTDKKTGQTCILGGGIRHKFFASIKQARFPEDKAVYDEDIFVLDSIGPQAVEYFENVIDPNLIYQGPAIFGTPKWHCIVEILRSGATVEELRKACEFECEGKGSSGSNSGQQPKYTERVEL